MHFAGFIIRIYHDAQSSESQIITDGFTSVSACVRYVVLPSFSHAFGSLSDLAVKKIPELPKTVQRIALCYSA